MALCSVLITLNLLLTPAIGIEPITLGVGMGAATVFGTLGYEKVWCQFRECCMTPWIRHNVTQFEVDFRDNIFGQHLALSVVSGALKSHFRKIGTSYNSEHESKKALVLSFHGMTGSGKNYVSKFIAEAMFSEGLKSNYVHLFVTGLHFPDDSKADIYRLHITDWVRGNVSSCPLRLFIFDEVDKMQPVTLNGVKPFIDSHEIIDGVDFRQTVFIFLSNSGSFSISEKVEELWKRGVQRENIKLKDLESIIMRGAYNEQGGLQDSELIYHQLVDYYVPFLPLRVADVTKCVEVELERQLAKAKVRCVNSNVLVKDVVEAMDYYGVEDQPLFSKTGCKRVLQKVDVVITGILEVLAHQKTEAYTDLGDGVQCRHEREKS